jgi:replicative DNA helicase
LNSIILSQNFKPFDEDAERAILGSLIVYPEVRRDIISSLRRDIISSLRRDIISSLSNDDFYLQKHKVIYQVIVDLFYQGKVFDINVLRNELQKQGKLDEIGGNAYLLQILDESVPTDIAHQIVNILREKTKIRRTYEKTDGNAK